MKVNENVVLNKSIVRDIVKDIHSMIGFETVFYNPRGEVLASTVESKDIYQVAIDITNSNSKVVLRDKNKGLYLPIYFNKNLVGILGILGDYENFKKMEESIKMFTEFLVENRYRETQKRFLAESQRLLIEEIIFKEKLPKNITERLQMHSIPHNKPCFLMVGRIVKEGVITPETSEKIITDIRDWFKDIEGTIVTLSGSDIIILCFQDLNSIKDLLIQMTLSTRVKYTCNLYYGIGTKYDSILDLKESYKEARDALDVGLKSSKCLVEYKELGPEILKLNLDHDSIVKYISGFTKDITIEEFLPIKDTVECYMRNNGSIKGASEELYIHKNTFQYRLKKINDTIGLDPRNMEDLVQLYLLVNLVNLDKDRELFKSEANL